MDILPVIFAVVIIILTVVLSVVGVQIILVLNEVRRTLRRVNTTLDMAEQRINAVVAPLQNLGGVAQGLTTGFKVFEGFVKWLNKDKESSK